MQLGLTTRTLIAGSLACLIVPTVGIGQSQAQPQVGVAASTAAAAEAATRGISVKWDWSMPTFMVDTKTFVTTNDKNDPNWVEGGSYVAGPDGIPDKPMSQLGRYQNAGNAVYGALPANRKFVVALDASASTGKGSLKCAWQIKTGKKTVRVTGPCAKKQQTRLTEGRHNFELTVSNKSGARRTIASHLVVKNVLVAVMGDSYGSGEGFPPFTEATASGTGRQIDWDYASCNRSRWSGFVRAAQQIESADRRSNVTLVDVACAGGEVDKGYIRAIKSVLPPPPVTEEIPTGGILYPKRRLNANGVQLPGYEEPQVDQVRAITRGATLDSVLLSIGGNDAGLSDIGIACALEDFAKPNCYNQVPFFWDTKPNARPLYEVIDDNMKDVKKRYQRMAPCFGADGTCKTTKVKGGKPAKKATGSTPLTLVRSKNLVHAMYPDLTSTMAETATGAAASRFAPCTNKPLPESPMNQIDNSWAWDTLYIGKAGKAVTLPESYSPPLPLPNPEVITPEADGLAPLITSNARRYGWTPELGVMRQSRGHGLCAPVPWEYGLTTASVAKDPANASGALHPNDLGQAAYGDVLGAKAQKLTGVPVKKPRSATVHGLG